MWRSLTARLADEGRTRLIWDVEDPDEAGLSRGRWSRSTGAGSSSTSGSAGGSSRCASYRPPHDDGHAPQLLLMDAPLADEPDPPLRELVETVYLRRYGVPAEDDVVRRTLLASCLLQQ